VAKLVRIGRQSKENFGANELPRVEPIDPGAIRS
jgi:hypothetical protein